MTRSGFIESVGATRCNTRWSWSAVNHQEKFIVFGAWDEYATAKGSLILSEDWVLNRKKTRRNPGYPESREHLRLVEEEDYSLKIFAMRMVNSEEHLKGDEPARIRDFQARLLDRKLEKHGREWFAIE